MFERGKKTILVVDDDATILTATKTILSGNYEVFLAQSAEVAMTIMKTTSVHLILLDVEMPGLSGLTYIEYLRSQAKFYFIPVIFITSHATQDVILKATRSGARDFMVKPLLPRILLDKIEAALQSVQAPITRDALMEKLTSLQTACMECRSLRIEELTDDLTRTRFTFDIDTRIADIRKCARQLDYQSVLEKVGETLEVIPPPAQAAR
ncbi:MAG: response regulator [Spirochaetaceae bacterium]|jgi:DNA-binding response OmpR family regulator|nr:response regulator [Spirochaetaceae bacterium]